MADHVQSAGNVLRRWAAAALVGLLGLVLGTAHAGSLTRTNYGGFEVLGSGKSWTFGDAKPRPGDIGWVDDYVYSGSQAKAGPYSFSSPSGGVPAVSARGNLPIPGSGGRSVPVDAMARIPKSGAARAMASWGMRFAGVAGAAYTAYEVYTYFRDRGYDLKDGVWTKPDPNAYWCTTGTCYEYAATGSLVGSATDGPYDRSPYNAAQWYVGKKMGACDGSYFINSASVSVYNATSKSYYVSVTCSDGRSFPNTTTLYQRSRSPDVGPAPTQVVTQQELEDKIASESGWPSSASRTLAEAIDEGGESVAHDTPTVSGPATIPGPSETKTESTTKPGPDGTTIPGTKTTNTTTNYTNNYTNNTVTVTATTTTTSTTIYNDGTTETSTETKEEEPQCKAEDKTVGCAEMDVPEGEIPKTSKALTYAAEVLGFGGGSCPQDITVSVQGGTSLKVFSYAKGCELVSGYVKPVVLLLSLWAAYIILIPGGPGRVD